MRRTATTLILALAAVTAAAAAYADDDTTSLSYISYLERYATVRPAHGDETLDAVVNMPVLGGDRLDTSRGARVEIQLADGTTVWVDEFSTLDFDALAFSREDPAPRTVLYLADGSAAVEIPEQSLGDGTLRIDSPAGTVFLQRPGLYRLDLRSGQLHVQALAGLAELPAGMGSALLRGGEEAWFSEGSSVQRAAMRESYDSFWSWVQDRRSPSASTRTTEVVGGNAAPRAAVLDSYGEWVYVSSFSTWAWRPRVSVGWVPYTYGRWYWTPVGWTWISYEPWGWYPFHYGSWYLDAGFGWVWCWDQVWGPAWVHWFYTPGYVGWCPRGYYDWWYWDHHHGAPGYRYPGRWRDVTLDLHGRVSLRDIDMRPWTIVPSRSFTNSRLDRVRVAPDRFVRDLPGDGRGYVRSGPLLTGAPGRTEPERAIESVFRDGPGQRDVPDLTRVLGREGDSGSRGTVSPTVRTLPTRDVAESSERTRERSGVGGGQPAARETTRDRLNREVGRTGSPDRTRPATPPRGESGASTERPGSTRTPVRSVDRDGRPTPERGSPSGTQPPARSPGETTRPSTPSRPPTGSSSGSGRSGVSPAPSRPSSPSSRPSSPPPPPREAPPPRPEGGRQDSARTVTRSSNDSDAIRVWRNQTYGDSGRVERQPLSGIYPQARDRTPGSRSVAPRSVEGLSRPSTPNVTPRVTAPPTARARTVPRYTAPRVSAPAPSYRSSPAPRASAPSPRTSSSHAARPAPSRSSSARSSSPSHSRPRHRD